MRFSSHRLRNLREDVYGTVKDANLLEYEMGNSVYF